LLKLSFIYLLETKLAVREEKEQKFYFKIGHLVENPVEIPLKSSKS
jgi:hypothetical protein